MAHDDEEQIEDDVDDTGDQQIVQRTARVAHRAQHAVAEVEQRQRRHAQQVYVEIQLCAVDQLVLRAQQCEQRPAEDQPQRHDHKADDQRKNRRGVDGVMHVVVAARAERPRHQHVYAVAQADQKAGEQRHEDGRRADGTQLHRAGKAADDRHVGHIEEHLQYRREHQRHAERENLPGQRPLSEIARITGHKRNTPPCIIHTIPIISL